MRHIHLIRKPTGAVGISCIHHGTGALHINATRVGTQTMTESRMKQVEGGIYEYHDSAWEQRPNDNPNQYTGRWPANALFHADVAATLESNTNGISRFFKVVQ